MSARRAAAWVSAASLALLACVIVFVARNNLLEHDLAGHLAMATFVREHLWPAWSGWDPRFFCGAPVGEWYPPLTAWLAATFSFAVGVPLALKLVIAAAVVATPPAIYSFARAYGLSAAGAALAAVGGTLYLALDRQELGANFYSTFVVGNVTNGVVLPLLFVALAQLPSLQKPSRPWTSAALPALLLALVLLTHLVAGMVALGFVVVERSVTLWHDRSRAPSTIVYLALAFFLAAFFCIPLVLGLRYGARTPFSYNQYPTPLVETLLYYALLIALFVRARDRRPLAPVALAMALLFVGRSFVFNDFLPRAITIHLHRFVPYERLFAIVLLAALVEPLLEARRRATELAFALAAVAILIATLLLPVRGVPDQTLPPLERLDSRVMVVSSPESQVSDHALQHLVPLRTKNEVAKGLFIELGANAPYLIDLERIVAERPVRAWGIAADPPRALEHLSSELAVARLRHLGFGFIVANEPLRSLPGLTVARALGDGFTLYKLGEAPLVEIWRGDLAPVAAADFEPRAHDWFLGAGGALPIAATEAPGAAAADARITAWRRDRDGQWLSFDVSSPAPVLVKISWAPDWRAEDEAGHPLSLIEAAPHLMLVGARGHVTLRYAPSRLARGLRWLALIVFFSTLALLVFSRIRARRS